MVNSTGAFVNLRCGVRVTGLTVCLGVMQTDSG
jgi:hypothetical protein